MRLTEQSIRKLPAPPRGNKIHYDNLVKGLGLRVTAADRRAFVLNYRTNGRERRLTIGSWPEWSATAARERAKELRQDIDRGDDPLAERVQRRTDLTFGELVNEYLKIEAAKQKGESEYKRLLKRDALPEWRNIRAADIKRRDVIALVEAKAKTAPIVANRLLELIRRVYNFAIRRDIVEANPCALVKKPGQEHAKDRVLSHHEIRSLWASLDGPWFTAQTKAALRLILVTAQRPGEVVSMRWEDLDLENGWWTIPSERAKNTLAHRVPLNQTAREILQSLPPVAKWVFPSTKIDQHMDRNGLAVAVWRARKRKQDPLAVLNFSPHDLRRTAASHMASVGVERFVIGRLLNHVEPGVTKVYDRHSYDGEKRKAMDKWGHTLRAILGTSASADVVVIR